MDQASRQQALAEMARVNEALEKNERFFEGVDIARAALRDEPDPDWSALRALTVHARTSAAFVTGQLRDATT